MKKLFTFFLSIYLSILCLSAQVVLFEQKDSTYQLSILETEMFNTYVQPHMSEAHWFIEFNPVQSALIEGILNISLPINEGIYQFNYDATYSPNSEEFWWSGATSNGDIIQVSKSNEGGFWGSLHLAVEDEYFGFQSLSNETAALIKYNKEYLDLDDHCAETTDSITEPIVNEVPSCENSQNRIRVLVLFSPDAGSKVPSQRGMAKTIISQLNGSSFSSGLTPNDISFELANVLLLPGFNEHPCSPITMQRLLDNQLAEDLRVQNWADVVCLIIDEVDWPFPPCDASGNAVNNAGPGEAYCFAQINTAIIQYKAAHGIGHVLDLDHQRCSNCANIRCSLNNNYPHGFKINSSTRTIMADCDGTERVSRWATDNVPYMGDPTGNSANDNARRLKEKATEVSCFLPNPPSSSDILLYGPTSLCQGANRLYLVTGQGNLQSAVWEKRNSNSPFWEIIDNGAYTYISAPPVGEFIFLRVTVPGVGSQWIMIIGQDCSPPPPPDDRANSQALSSLEITPNPASDKLLINGLPAESNITLYNLNGEIMLSTKASEHINLDISELPSGLFFISLYSAGHFSTHKIIKL